MKRPPLSDWTEEVFYLEDEISEPTQNWAKLNRWTGFFATTVVFETEVDVVGRYRIQ